MFPFHFMHSFVNLVLCLGFGLAPYGNVVDPTQSLAVVVSWLVLSGLSLVDTKPQDSAAKAGLIIYTYSLAAAVSCGLCAYAAYRGVNDAAVERDLLFYGLVANQGFGALASCTGIYHALSLHILNTASSKKNN